MKKLDLNAWLRYLRRQYPLMWAVASTLGHIVRAAVRTCLPIGVSFVLFRSLLEPIVFDDNQSLPHWVALLTAAFAMAVMIVQDGRWRYGALSARGGVERPSLWHDIKVVFGSGSYWTTILLSAVSVSSFADYLVGMFVPLAPDSPLQQMLLAGIVPTAVFVLYETILFFVTLRVWYRTVPADEELAEPQLPSTFEMVLQVVVWVLVLIFSPVAAWVFVVAGMLILGLLRAYFMQAIVLAVILSIIVVIFRLLRAWRVRSRCVRKLRREMEESRIHYEFEKHPIRSAFFGGEKVSLRVYLGDRVILVRMVPFYSRMGTLIVTPDGNVGQLHRIALGRVMFVPRYGASRVNYANFDPSGRNAKKNALTEWITKRETVFEDARYPDAEKIYLISPTPKFWVAGDLKATANLDNGSRAYGYTLWTTSAFCRHLRMKQEDFMRGR